MKKLTYNTYIKVLFGGTVLDNFFVQTLSQQRRKLTEDLKTVVLK